MIKPGGFYSKDETLDKFTRIKIWRKISKELTFRQNHTHMRFHFKSFALGAAATVIAFFTFTGVYTTVDRFSNQKLPEQIKINNAYKNAINNFEKTLPIILKTQDRPVKIDDLINSHREELLNLNYAIDELSSEIPQRDYSELKQIRLRELYRLKLKVLDEIIELEENQR